MPSSPADRRHRSDGRAPAPCAAGSGSRSAGYPTRRRNPARGALPDATLGGGGLTSRAKAARTLVDAWRDPGSSMPQLPLSGRVIFSDWHGVLSRDAFWASILQHSGHPLHAELKAGMAGVFNRDANTAEEWMLGRLSSGEAVGGMGIRPRARLRADFLRRRPVLDAGRGKARPPLFGVVPGAGGRARGWVGGEDGEHGGLVQPADPGLGAGERPGAVAVRDGRGGGGVDLAAAVRLGDRDPREVPGEQAG